MMIKAPTRFRRFCARLSRTSPRVYCGEPPAGVTRVRADAGQVNRGGRVVGRAGGLARPGSPAMSHPVHALTLTFWAAPRPRLLGHRVLGNARGAGPVARGRPIIAAPATSTILAFSRRVFSPFGLKAPRAGQPIFLSGRRRHGAKASRGFWTTQPSGCPSKDSQRARCRTLCLFGNP